MSKKTYFITGGGTGGHIYPAIAVADELISNPENTVYYVGNPDNLEYGIAEQKGYNFLPVHVKGMPRKLSLHFIFWGIPKIYKYGVNVRATSYNGISENTLKSIDKKTTALAKKIKAKDGKVKVGIKTKAFFELMRIIQMKSGWNEADTDYWHNKGWDGKKRPWK